jgi:hypothetical protein
VAVSPGGRTMSNSSGAVGAVMSATDVQGGVGVGGVTLSPLTAMGTESRHRNRVGARARRRGAAPTRLST